MKTNAEQAEDLRTAVSNMSRLRENIVAGQHELVGYLAAELRALLYWRNDAARDNTYSPLLLRLASKADLPLPVFAMPWPDPAAPDIVTQADHRMRSLAPSLIQSAPAEQLMDLQEWLLQPVLTVRDPSGGPGLVLTARDVISETANCLGSAHYDEDISDVLAEMRRTILFNASLLVRSHWTLAGTVAELATWVLSELGRRGLPGYPDGGGDAKTDASTGAANHVPLESPYRGATSLEQALQRFEGAPGLAIQMMVLLDPIPGRDNYVLDVGVDEARNRVSIFLDYRSRLCLRVIDAKGTRYDLRADAESGAYLPGLPGYISVIVGTQASEMLMAIESGEWSDWRTVSADEGWVPPAEFHYVMGADLRGREDGVRQCPDYAELGQPAGLLRKACSGRLQAVGGLLREPVPAQPRPSQFPRGVRVNIAGRGTRTPRLHQLLRAPASRASELR
jgi:hypothetical protein